MSLKSASADEKNSTFMINTLWDEIGYTQDEKDEGIRKINSEIEKVRSKFIESTLKQCQKVLEETEQIRSTHISMLKAIDAPEDQIREVKENGRKGTIKEKYDEVKTKFKVFLKIYKQKYTEFENLQKQIDNCFKAIGITNPSAKGEFNEVGQDDLTPARFRRYEEKVNQLSNEVDSRLLKFNSFKKKILSMNCDLQEDLPPEIDDIFEKQVYSDQVLDKLKEFISYLKDLFDTRSQFVSEMAVEINRLWDLLEVDEPTRREFLSSHNTLSQKNVQDCIDEADRLIRIRNRRLPEIIEKMKLDLSTICQYLGYSKQKEKEICEKCEDIEKNNSINDNNIENDNNSEDKNDNDNNDSEDKNDNDNNNHSEDKNDNDNNNNSEDKNDILDDHQTNQDENNNDVSKSENKNEASVNDEINESLKTDDENVADPNLLQIFNNFNSEILNLKKTLIFAQPIIDLINQREQIINDYNEVMNKPEKKPEPVDNQIYNPEIVKIRRYDQLNGKNIKLRNQRALLPDHKEKLHSEKVIRRHRFVLPRIEKKLYIMLLQYREEQKGEDFIWKDKPIIKELGNIQVTQDEINQNKIRFNKIKKKIEMNNDTEIDGDPLKSSKHRKSMFANYDRIEPKKNTEDSNNNKSPRKSTLPKKLRKIIAED